MRAFYDSHIERDGRADLPTSHDVSVTYRDSSGHAYVETAVIDIDAMKGTMFAEVKTVHDIGKSLADIQQILKNAAILGRQGKLDVEASVEPRGARQRRLAEERATASQRHDEFVRRISKRGDAE